MIANVVMGSTKFLKGYESRRKGAEATEEAKPISFQNLKSAACLVLIALCTFLSACTTTMQVGSPFQAGRRALIGGDDEAALGFFQTVAESNPNFVFTTGSSPRQSIWSYVGRTQYLTDQFPQARQSLERALSGDREENIARLYLGLTLIQLGDRAARLERNRKRDARDPEFSR